MAHFWLIGASSGFIHSSRLHRRAASEFESLARFTQRSTRYLLLALTGPSGRGLRGSSEEAKRPEVASGHEIVAAAPNWGSPRARAP
jgi:hypothetical protein